MTQDTRKDPRAKIVSLNVRYKSATVDEFIENHSHDVSKGGIFIKTSTPFPQGTLLKFEIRLAGDQAVIAGVGRVVWKREPTQAGAEQPAGMGVKFIKIDESSRAVIDRLVGAKEGAGSAFTSELKGESGARTSKSTPPGGLTAKTASAAPPRPGKSTLLGVGANPAPGSAPPGKAGASAPPRPGASTLPGGTAAGGFFPKTNSEEEMPAPAERTMMKQAAELLEEALKGRAARWKRSARTRSLRARTPRAPTSPPRRLLRGSPRRETLPPPGAASAGGSVPPPSRPRRPPRSRKPRASGPLRAASERPAARSERPAAPVASPSQRWSRGARRPPRPRSRTTSSGPSRALAVGVLVFFMKPQLFGLGGGTAPTASATPVDTAPSASASESVPPTAPSDSAAVALTDAAAPETTDAAALAAADARPPSRRSPTSPPSLSPPRPRRPPPRRRGLGLPTAATATATPLRPRSPARRRRRRRLRRTRARSPRSRSPSRTTPRASIRRNEVGEARAEGVALRPIFGRRLMQDSGF